MKIADLKNVKIHYTDQGDPKGRVVVFANSLGTDLRLWDKIMPLLPKGLRYIRFDKRGHGLSSCPNAPYEIMQLVEDTEQLLDYLGVCDCVFVGLSIGGMIAQGLAARRPDLIRAMVLSNTAAQLGDAKMWQSRIKLIESSGIDGQADTLLQRWFGAGFLQSAELTAWRNMLIRTPVEGYIGCCHAIAGADFRGSTTTLQIPVLGIAGSEDGASPPDLVRDTIALIADARYAEIKGAGHLPCVEAPDEYAALLSGFLKEVAHV